MIKAKNITKIYTNEDTSLTVFENLNFSASKGEFVIITGQSGCGKSTLLNVLSCLDDFQAGELTLNNITVGNKITDIYKLRQNDMSFIFQSYNLISSLSSIENVMLPLKYINIPFKTRYDLAFKSLEKVGLSDKINNPPHRLSGGQQQRVAIARALVTTPKILFCDEPTGNLDKETSNLVLNSILQLRKNGSCIIMITHDMNLLPLADTVYILDKGILKPM